jgi:hypothetical protein
MSTSQNSPLRSGWILASGVLLLCLLGTWMTVRTYRTQVVSSEKATVLQNQWPESRIVAEFSAADLRHVRPGMMARITLSGDSTVLTGRVLSLGSGTNAGTVVVALVGEAGDAGRVPMIAPSGAKPHHYLPAGASCAVTIDGTIPPEELAAPR